METATHICTSVIFKELFNMFRFWKPAGSTNHFAIPCCMVVILMTCDTCTACNNIYNIYIGLCQWSCRVSQSFCIDSPSNFISITYIKSFYFWLRWYRFQEPNVLSWYHVLIGFNWQYINHGGFFHTWKEILSNRWLRNQKFCSE